jgi:glycosyltransferase involved in cell wall biosynthesis
MTKKVAIIYSGAKYWGGVESYLKNLFKLYDRSKVELTLISLGSWPAVREIEKLGGHIKVFSIKRFNPITILRIASFLRKEKFSLIVSGGFVADSYARGASLFAGISHLSIVHSEFKYDYPNPFIRFIYTFLLVISRWKTKKYITVSEYLKNSLIKSGVNGKKIAAVYNGVEFGGFHKEKKDDNSKIVISSIGRLHKVKGYDNLIRAVPLIKGDNWIIKIYGEGEERDNLESLIAQVGVSEKVNLCGHADSIKDVLSESDIYIQPSISEGFGLTVVEAMGAGLPVIVTPRGSLTEIVKDNITGLITKGTDLESLAVGVNAALSNMRKAEKLGMAALDDVRKRFDANLWAKNLVDTFLEIAK